MEWRWRDLVGVDIGFFRCRGDFSLVFSRWYQQLKDGTFVRMARTLSELPRMWVVRNEGCGRADAGPALGIISRRWSCGCSPNALYRGDMPPRLLLRLPTCGGLTTLNKF
jgi:hypothetical protein